MIDDVDVVITIIAHGPARIAERETILSEGTTGLMVDVLGDAGLTVDQIDANLPDTVVEA